jgi:hypothetical protein
VFSKQGAVFYKAHQGEIEKITEFEVENPRYSDREGFFMSRSKDVGTIRAGSVGEVDDDQIKRDFFEKFREALKSYKDNLDEADDVYLFAPAKIISDLKEELPKNIQDKIFMEFQKNYRKLHPFKILTKIDEELTRKISAIKDAPRTEEEKKILEVGKK